MTHGLSDKGLGPIRGSIQTKRNNQYIIINVYNARLTQSASLINVFITMSYARHRMLIWVVMAKTSGFQRIGLPASALPNGRYVPERVRERELNQLPPSGNLSRKDRQLQTDETSRCLSYQSTHNKSLNKSCIAAVSTAQNIQ